MNIVEASYKVGLALKQSREGKELLSLYKEAKEDLPLHIWRDFEKMGRKKWGQHYFRYPYSLAIFNANREQDDLPLPLKEEIVKVLNSDKIQIFCNKCEKFGMSLEEVVKNIFSPTIPKTFADIDTPPKLARALQDLSISCQRTGLFKLLLINFKSKEFQKKINEFEDKKKDVDSLPFSHNTRKLARDISNDKVSTDSIYLMEAFSVVLDVIKQVAFESHFDLILNLNNEDIKTFRKHERNKLALFSMQLNEHMFDIMNWNGSILNFYKENYTNFALIKRKKLSWKTQASPVEIGLWGIIYPHDDFVS